MAGSTRHRRAGAFTAVLFGVGVALIMLGAPVGAQVVPDQTSTTTTSTSTTSTSTSTTSTSVKPTTTTTTIKPVTTTTKKPATTTTEPPFTTTTIDPHCLATYGYACFPDTATEWDCPGSGGDHPLGREWRNIKVFYDVPNPDPYDLDHNKNGVGCESDESVPGQSAAPAPTTTTKTSVSVLSATATACDASYPTLCLPSGLGRNAINCDSAAVGGATNFTVRQPDPYGLDADNDGVGCESDSGGRGSATITQTADEGDSLAATGVTTRSYLLIAAGLVMIGMAGMRTELGRRWYATADPTVRYTIERVRRRR